MTNKTNNPPEVLVPMSLEDAEMLAKDFEAAQMQLLGVLQKCSSSEEPPSRQFLEGIVSLLEFKKRVKEATQKATDERI